jgi:sugar phosphate isomerase/epimerase
MTLLSMNELTTYRWSLEQDVENYQQAGYRAIGIWRQKLSDWDEDDAVNVLLDSGLQVSHVAWAGGFTGSDGRTPAESIDDAGDALRLAASLNAGCLVIYPGGRNNHTFRHAGRLLRFALDELLPLAEMRDVPLAIEPMHAACAPDWSFLTDVPSVVALIEEYNSRFLKLAYDVYHFPFDARRRHQLAKIVPHIAVVHLGDRCTEPSVDQDRCMLGRGLLPLREIVTTLQHAGYDGAFDVKLLGPDIETQDYWTLLEHSLLAFHKLVPAPGPPSLA